MPAWELKGRWFDSQWAHAGLGARLPDKGMRQATDLSIFHASVILSLSFSLTPPLSKTKQILKK